MTKPLFVSASLFCGTAIFLTAYLRLTQNVYPSEYLRGLAKEHVQTTDEFPLKGKVAIVTGSTNGLGKEIARKLYELGCTVVIASRSKTKSEATVYELQNKAELEFHFGNKAGYLESISVDTSDLLSVQSFVKSFLKTHNRLDFLVNNAGIHYASDGVSLGNTSDLVSAQGYDLAFATNYLGHFLLTELLLPVIQKTSSASTSSTSSTSSTATSASSPTAIVNIASAYHFLSDGVALKPPTSPGEQIAGDPKTTPDAARGDINTRDHRYKAYGNNKLAQVLHAKELQRRLNNKEGKNEVTGTRVVAACPGWVATGILPDIVKPVMNRLAFTAESATLAPLYALFAKDLHGGEFVTHYHNPLFRCTSLIQLASKLGLRGMLIDLFAGVMVLTQGFTYTGRGYVEVSSPESHDEELARELYDWSKKEVSAYL